MANSKLLKEAIADAKSVRETAIANAKIALEEAFTPQLQSILSQKLQAEMEEEEADMVEDAGDDSSEIGAGDNKEPQDGEVQSADGAHTELDPETEEETAEVGHEDESAEEVSEGEEEVEEVVAEEEEVEEATISEEEHEDEVEEGYHEEEDEDELDLAEIIRELEEELAEMEVSEEEEVEEGNHEESEVEEAADDVDAVQDVDDPHSYNEEEEVEEVVSEEEESEEAEEEEDEDEDDDIDLEEILREMGYGEEEEVEETYHEEEDSHEEVSEMEAELEEAYATIKELQSTINEVNLLNAKLLYTNKLFRSYELTNEQKMKVVETLDRTGNVREVKLVYSTLAESFKYNNGTVTRKPKTKITESFASKATRSTAPQKEIISESTNAMAERFKKLANIK